MTITVLGCGGAWSRILGHTSFLVEHRDIKLLIDCGSTVPARVEEFSRLQDITHIFLSHLHADHAGGLEEVGFKGLFIHKKRPILLVPAPLMPILWPNYLAVGMRNLLTDDGKQDRIATLDTYFQAYPIVPMQFVQLGDSNFHLAIYRTQHVASKPNFSILVLDQDSGKKVLFTCDVTAGNKLPYNSADLIFHDCSFTPKYPTTVHTHIEDLLVLSREIQAKTVCTHYGDDTIERQPLLTRDIAPLRVAHVGARYVV
jgi:ribonuclease BN (tRNA processing enzyme)